MQDNHNVINKHILRNLGFLIFSIALALILARLGVVDSLILRSQEIRLIGVLVAGIFYTSVLTVGPATLTLSAMMEYMPVYVVAAIGAAGAVLGDSLIFLFVRKRISGDIAAIFERPGMQGIGKIFKLGFLQWLTPVIGFLIIASPLPDELGLAMMGISSIKPGAFALLAYVANFLGILALGIVIHTLL